MGFKFIYLIFILFFSLTSQAQITIGLWKTPCLGGAQKEQHYTVNFLVRTDEMFFFDSNCNKKSILFRTDGSVNYPENNFTDIDFTYESIYLTVFSEKIISDFNTRNVCGHSDWKINEPKTITGLTCALFNSASNTQIPKKGDRRFGIYRQTSDKLVYGKLSSEKNGSTPERRPTELNLVIEYIFQNSL